MISSRLAAPKDEGIPAAAKVASAPARAAVLRKPRRDCLLRFASSRIALSCLTERKRKAKRGILAPAGRGHAETARPRQEKHCAGRAPALSPSHGHDAV